MQKFWLRKYCLIYRKMSSFSLPNGKPKRFSIDDAFEEETDEAIKVYGATGPRIPISNTTRNTLDGDHIDVNMESGRSSTLNECTKLHLHGTLSSSPVDIDVSPYDTCLKALQYQIGTYKVANDASRDSDSLIQGYYDCSSQENLNRSCFNHPKVQENWRMVLAAATLLIIGLGLLMTGMITLAEPNSGLQGSVFLLAGFICFLPGIYHIVYIYLAAKGKRGYHFHNLPLFT